MCRERRERRGRRRVKPLCGSFATLRPWRVTRLHPKACDSMRSLVGEQVAMTVSKLPAMTGPAGYEEFF